MSKVALQGNSSGAGTITIQSPNTASNRTLLLPDESGTIPVKGNVMEYGPTIATLNAAVHDITGVPSWVKKITIFFNGASTNGTVPKLIQLGSTTFQTTGYLSSVMSARNAGTGAGTVATNGFALDTDTLAAYVYDGVVALYKTNLASNIWQIDGRLGDTTGIRTNISTGKVTLTGVLDRIRITTANGTDVYDAGSISTLYEG